MKSTTKSSQIDKVPLLDVGRGNAPLKEEILQSISEIIDTGRFVGGPFNQFLENAVAEATGAKHAIGCASGSDSLLLALMAIDIKPGDEVICPSFTFFATASAIHRLGGVPVFIDICPDTFNLDPNRLEELITTKTKAIIPVHLFGQAAEMEPILDIAKAYQLKVIEDCAQSIGATDQQRGVGSMGDVGCFSFYPTKNLGGFGDGGMLTTNCDHMADRLRLLANHGMRPRYYHQVVGINSRLDAIQAAVLCAKVKQLDQYSSRRQKNASLYTQFIEEKNLGQWLKIPVVADDKNHVWNQYTVRVPEGKRDLVRSYLAEHGVGAEIYYPVPLHRQECFEYLKVSNLEMIETNQAAEEVLALPIFPELTEPELRYVVNTLEGARDYVAQQDVKAA